MFRTSPHLGILVLVSSGLAFAAPTHGVTIRVPVDAPTIQAGIDSASAGDTVLVESGTYFEHNVNIGSGICLRSETGDPDCVTIDAARQGRVLYCWGVDNTTRIEGFTITCGVSGSPERSDLVPGTLAERSGPPRAGHPLFGDPAGRAGGGMVCYFDASPRVLNCVFANNSANHGGGVWCYESSPMFDNCVFSDNVAAAGGGISSSTSSVTLVGCTFSGCSASEHGGGMICDLASSAALVDCIFHGNSATNHGGGIYMSSPFPTVSLTGCVFSGNSAMVGGGMYCRASSPALTDCTFLKNSADDAGGIHCRKSSPVLVNCGFLGNSADYAGGMYCSLGSSPTLTNCTFAGNSASQGGGVVQCMYDSSPTLENTIIAFSTQGEAVGCYQSSPTLICCDVYGNAGGDWVDCIAEQYGINGNFSADPFFCDPDMGDFSLNYYSPCSPVKQPDCGLIGAWPIGCDWPTGVAGSAQEIISWSSLKALYR